MPNTCRCNMKRLHWTSQVQLYAVIALGALALWFLFDRTSSGMAISLVVGIGSWFGYMLIATPYIPISGPLISGAYPTKQSTQPDGCPRHYSPPTSPLATLAENYLTCKHRHTTSAVTRCHNKQDIPAHFNIVSRNLARGVCISGQMRFSILFFYVYNV
jgi:Insulin-induced protein (INSIG)